MKGFKEQSFGDRMNRSATARQAMQQRLKAMPGPDDPAFIEQRAKRQAVVAARQARVAERTAAKLAAKAREAAEAEQKLARERQEAAELAEREAAEAAAREIERKAARDARYAARKARQGRK